MADLRILILDDSDDDAELLQIFLRDCGVQAQYRRAWSPDSLAGVLGGFEPQLVLSDVNMPGFPCTEALAIVRMHAPQARFAFVTGAVNDHDPPPAADALLLKDELHALPPLLRDWFG